MNKLREPKPRAGSSSDHFVRPLDGYHQLHAIHPMDNCTRQNVTVVDNSPSLKLAPCCRCHVLMILYQKCKIFTNEAKLFNWNPDIILLAWLVCSLNCQLPITNTTWKSVWCTHSRWFSPPHVAQIHPYPA